MVAVDTGDILSSFHSALVRFQAALMGEPVLCEAIFHGTEEWTRQLSYKLLPHLADGGCLIVAVAGGTNTGKSTVFNLLLGREVSPVRPTAAATRRPVLSVSPRRAEDCLQGLLVPEFKAQWLESPDVVLDPCTPPDSLWIVSSPDLPDNLAFMDTPDVDSIEKENWAIAEEMGVAGDVVVAVLTGEKYRDDRVVSYFRDARRSGRVVIPVMNKANPKDDFAIARQQLDTFRQDIDADSPGFALAHDFSLADGILNGCRIAALDGGPDLPLYLRALDTGAIKTRVYRSSVRHFATQASEFLQRAEEEAVGLEIIARQFEERARRLSLEYDPIPGAAVGGLFHEFVQQKRSPAFRWIGAAGKAMARGLGVVGRVIGKAVRRSDNAECASPSQTDADLRELHARALRRIAIDLVADCSSLCRGLRQPASKLAESGFASIDAEAAANAVVADVLSGDSVSAAFRAHAHRTLETWWDDHKGKRRIVEALDAILAVTPAALAVPIAIYTGPGLPEATIAVAGPVMEQFVARVFEYQFADAMFDFLSPWKEERQAITAAALREHVTKPGLCELRRVAEMLTGEEACMMRDCVARLL